MSDAYRKLLQKLDTKASSESSNKKLNTLQQKFSTLLTTTRKDFLGKASDDDEEEDESTGEQLVATSAPIKTTTRQTVQDDDEEDLDEDFDASDSDLEADEFTAQLLQMESNGDIDIDELMEEFTDQHGEIDLHAAQNAMRELRQRLSKNSGRSGSKINSNSKKSATNADDESKTDRAPDGSFSDVSEDEIGDEDDEMNVFEHDLDSDYAASDSELENNDADDVADDNNDNDENDDIETSSTATTTTNNKKSKSTPSTDQPSAADDKVNSSFLPYDEYFLAQPSKDTLRTLQHISHFATPRSGQIGLSLKTNNARRVGKSKHYNAHYAKALQQQLGKLSKKSAHQEEKEEDDDEDDTTQTETKPRVFSIISNPVRQAGTLLDHYHVMPRANVNSSDEDDDDEEEDDDDEFEESQLTAPQCALQTMQVATSRLALGLGSALPEMPISDTVYPIGNDGEPVVITPGETSVEKVQIPVPKRQQQQQKLKNKSSIKPRFKTVITHNDEITPTAALRTAPSFSSLGFKSRLETHLMESGIVSGTVYRTMHEHYTNYTPTQSHYDWTQQLQTAISSQQEVIRRGVVQTQDPSLLIPNTFSNIHQSLAASLISTYADVLINVPFNIPTQQANWYLYRDVYLLHMLNHLLIHRGRIAAHSEALYRRSARTQEERFIMKLGRVNDANERIRMLEERQNQLLDTVDDESKTSEERQDAQARLSVLLNSHKTRVQLHQMQIEREKEAATEAAANPHAPTRRATIAKQEKQKEAARRHLSDTEFQQSMRTLQQDTTADNGGGGGGSNPTTKLRDLDLQLSAKVENRYRDQGFTRPTILLLLPTRGAAYSAIMRLLELIPPKHATSVQGLEAFHSQFGDKDGIYHASAAKSLDYQLTFQGNSDDCFRFGIQFSRSSVKLFCPLYSSDIIVASPLGLKLVVGSESFSPHERKADFLSSIEMCIVDQLQLINFQNIDHFKDVMQSLNGFPTATSNIDFGRVRNYYFDGHARFYRQNLWFGSVFTPELLHLFNTYAENKNGQIRIRLNILPDIKPYCQQRNVIKTVLRRIDLTQHSTLSGTTGSSYNKPMLSEFARDYDDDEGENEELKEEHHFDRRLRLWFNDIWPRIKDWYQQEGNTMIVVPSSYDFIRIRNIFKEKFVDFCLFSEYTEHATINKYRQRIHQGDAKFILVSERFFVFNRVVLRNIRHIVWYAPPTLPQTYIDYLNALKPPSNDLTTSMALNSAPVTSSFSSLQSKLPTSFIIYSLEDMMALERILGTEVCRELLQNEEDMVVLS